eukprot:1820913-Rhodomonas_salina.1
MGVGFCGAIRGNRMIQSVVGKRLREWAEGTTVRVREGVVSKIPPVLLLAGNSLKKGRSQATTGIKYGMESYKISI